LFVSEEKSSEYEALKKQFNAYHNNDFMFNNRFHEYVNEASLSVSKSIVKIKVDVIHQDGYTVVTRYGSGSVFQQENNKYFILSVDSILMSSENQSIRLQITDYKGNIYTGQRIHMDGSLKLGVISINVNQQQPLPLVRFSSNNPLINEPILLISYRGQIMNSMVMGFVAPTEESDSIDTIVSTISSDVYGNGGAIFNNNLEIVGVQYATHINQSIGINLIGIYSYLSVFQSYLDSL
jgi:hypothetical protein